MQIGYIRLLMIIAALLHGGITHTTKNKSLFDLAKAITKSSYCSRNNARETLLHSLKDHTSTDIKTLSCVFTAFHYKNDTLLSQHSDTIYEAIERFSKTPGFTGKIHTLLTYANHPSIIKGHIFEVETALSFDEHEEKITNFSYDFKCAKNQIEGSIDLATENYLIECKDVQWEKYIKQDSLKKANKIKAQLLKYQAFTKEPANNQNRTLLLVSKQPIPDAWKNWLNEKHIEHTVLETQH